MISAEQLDKMQRAFIDDAAKEAEAWYRRDPTDVAAQTLSFLDLTSLGDGDTPEKIAELCGKANEHNPAALCIWLQFVEQARETLSPGIEVATVVNFPESTDEIYTILTDIVTAMEAGADEIDIVFPYKHFMQGDLGHVENVLDAARGVTGEKKLKVILESGAFDSADQLYAAARMAIDNGADFIKTSTGKTDHHADINAATVMLTAIKDSGEDVGLKISGGVKTARQAADYLALAKIILGNDWPDKDHFRFGASSVLDDLSRILKAKPTPQAARPGPPQKPAC